MLPRAALLAAALLAGACGDEEVPAGRPPDPGPVACTRASCMGGAEVRLRGIPAGAASAEVCVGGRCETFRRPIGDDVRVGLPPEDTSGGPSTRTAEATAEVRDRAGAVVARGSAPIRLTALRPNGRRCAPTCWGGNGTIELRAR